MPKKKKPKKTKDIVKSIPDTPKNIARVLFGLRTCFKKKDTIQELMFTFNHWSSPY